MEARTSRLVVHARIQSGIGDRGSQFQQSMLGHHRPANETPFKWRFAGGTVMFALGGILISPHQLIKTLSELNWIPSDKTFWIRTWWFYQLYALCENRSLKNRVLHCRSRIFTTKTCFVRITNTLYAKRFKLR